MEMAIRLTEEDYQNIPEEIHRKMFDPNDSEIELNVKCKVIALGRDRWIEGKIEHECSYQMGTCESCRYKYVVSHDCVECRCNDSLLEYLDLDYFPDFGCNKFERKQ